MQQTTQSIINDIPANIMKKNIEIIYSNIMLVLLNYIPMTPMQNKEKFSLFTAKISAQQKEYQNCTSIFTAELYGILEAIKCRAKRSR